MTTDNDSAVHSERRPRVPLRIWVALAVAVMLAFASLAVIVHRPGVPTLVPGQKGAVRMSSSS